MSRLPKYSKRLSHSGNSGAWVLNMEGEVAGMITAGNVLNEAIGVSHYTVITTIFVKIEEATGRSVT